MNGRSFVAAACIVFGAGTAWAIDDRVLGRDDADFAQALVDNGYRDLAVQLLGVMAWSDGDRLFAEARRVNVEPDWRVSFVDWTPRGKVVEQPWIDAARAYESLLARIDDYRVAIRLGRTYGYLRRWTDASRVYARVFEKEPVLTQNGRKLDRDVLKAQPELTLAYLEWGVVERMMAKDAVDERERDERLNHCIAQVFFPLVFTVKPDRDGAVFWGATYHLVRGLMDKGLYKEARAKCEDLMRSVSPTFDDGKFGYQKLFEELR